MFLPKWRRYPDGWVSWKVHGHKDHVSILVVLVYSPSPSSQGQKLGNDATPVWLCSLIPPSISILSGLLSGLSPKAALRILVRWQTPVMSESYSLHMQKRRQSFTRPRWRPFEVLLIFGFDWPQIFTFLAISLYLENIY